MSKPSTASSKAKPAKLARPKQGGTYTRDPKTGDLKRLSGTLAAEPRQASSRAATPKQEG